MAAIFYLKNLYTKAFVKGFKWYYELNKRSYQFQYQSALKTASECFDKWKNEYYSMNVIHEIDNVRKTKLKRKYFKVFK